MEAHVSNSIRLPKSKRRIVETTIDGEAVVEVETTKVDTVTISASTWAEYIRLGYSLNISADDAGDGLKYPRTMARSSDPRQRRSSPYTLQRLLLCILSVIQEQEHQGPRTKAKGLIAQTVNGNRFDLRDENLRWTHSKGQRNSYRVLRDVRERRKLADQGLNPNAVFAERRRKAKSKCLGAFPREHMGVPA
jgi:hypothetical protein